MNIKHEIEMSLNRYAFGDKTAINWVIVSTAAVCAALVWLLLV